MVKRIERQAPFSDNELKKENKQKSDKSAGNGRNVNKVC